MNISDVKAEGLLGVISSNQEEDYKNSFIDLPSTKRFSI
jgi:hypothetical protein